MLKWINTAKGEAERDPSVRGYWRSVEGRFEIGPNYNHSIYPSGYTVSDNLMTANANRAGVEPDKRREIMNRAERKHDTVRECKAWAASIVTRELENS